MSNKHPSIAAIEYALSTSDGMTFLRCWLHGEFPEIRAEWPDAPEEVFIGADPLHPETKFGLEHDLRLLAEQVLALRNQSIKQTEVDRMKERELENCASTMQQTAAEIERGAYWHKA